MPIKSSTFPILLGETTISEGRAVWKLIVAGSITGGSNLLAWDECRSNATQ